MTDTRPCTCAPDERPYPCQHQYALGLCRKAEIRSLRAERDALQTERDLWRSRYKETVPEAEIDALRALLLEAIAAIENHATQRTFAGGVVLSNTAIKIRAALAGEKNNGAS